MSQVVKQAPHRIIYLLLAVSFMHGCAAGTVIDVVAETVEAGIEVTGAVVGTAVDIIVPGGDDEDESEED